MLATQPCLDGRLSVLPLDGGEHGEARMNRPAGEFWFAVAGGSVIVLAIAAVIASNVKPAWLDWLWKMLARIV
jgi:hypothetical protein